MKATSAANLAMQVKEQRLARNMNQIEMAQKIGLKQSTVSAFENTPGGTKLDTLFKLLSALDLELVIQPREQATDSTDADPEDW